MISYLCGMVHAVSGTHITLLCNDIGISLQTPSPNSFVPKKKIELFTYMHWNSDKGPSMYGFTTQAQRTLFLLIIACPHIGPSKALTILAQCTIGQFIHAVSTDDDTMLSSIHGIGSKKAKQIIAFLKDKVQKLLNDQTFTLEESNTTHTALAEVTKVLTSLNYSRTEITHALTYLSSEFSDQEHSLEQLIRASLAYLSKQVGDPRTPR